MYVGKMRGLLSRGLSYSITLYKNEYSQNSPVLRRIKCFWTFSTPFAIQLFTSHFPLDKPTLKGCDTGNVVKPQQSLRIGRLNGRLDNSWIRTEREGVSSDDISPSFMNTCCVSLSPSFSLSFISFQLFPARISLIELFCRLLLAFWLKIRHLINYVCNCHSQYLITSV